MSVTTNLADCHICHTSNSKHIKKHTHTATTKTTTKQTSNPPPPPKKKKKKKKKPSNNNESLFSITIDRSTKWSLQMKIFAHFLPFHANTNSKHTHNKKQNKTNKKPSKNNKSLFSITIDKSTKCGLQLKIFAHFVPFHANTMRLRFACPYK